MGYCCSIYPLVCYRNERIILACVDRITALSIFIFDIDKVKIYIFYTVN